MASTVDIPVAFLQRKKKIVNQLSIPAEDYDDRSPKGSVDEGVRRLICEIADQEGLVTTSSCAGRVSVFLEGRKVVQSAGREADRASDEVQRDTGPEQSASAGGKGGGGRWLYVSHTPVSMPVNPEDAGSYFTDLFGLSRGEKRRNPTHSRERRYLHFKFEPMILHVLTASPHHAQLVLQSAMLSGFRESGAMTSTSYARSGQLPMVAVRCQGLGLDSIIGYLDDGAEEPTDLCSMVDEDYLRTIVAVVNERFVENSKRTERFRQVLLGLCKHDATYKSGSEGWANAPWEDPEMRRARKRAQGLSQQRAAQTKKEPREGPDERQAESVEPLDQEDEVDILSGVGFNASP